MEVIETKCIYCEGELQYHSPVTTLCTKCHAVNWDDHSRRMREVLTEIPCKKNCGGRLVKRYPDMPDTDYYCVKCTAGHGWNRELACTICGGTIVDGQCRMCEAVYFAGSRVSDAQNLI